MCSSATHSSPVQPISARRSESAPWRSCRWSWAGRPSGSREGEQARRWWLARPSPPRQRRTGSAAPADVRENLDHRTSFPDSNSMLDRDPRSPRASSAGCTRAPLRSQIPPGGRVSPHVAPPRHWGQLGEDIDPRSRVARTASFQAPICASAVAVSALRPAGNRRRSRSRRRRGQWRRQPRQTHGPAASLPLRRTFRSAS